MVVSPDQSESNSVETRTATKVDSKQNLDPHNTKWSDINLLKFGALVTVSSTVENAIFYPFYVLKTREQSDRRNLTLFKSFQYHLRASFSKATNTTSKVPSLYRAFWFSNIISIPSYGLYLSVYISTKDYFNSSPNRSIQFCAPFLAGALADAVSICLYVPGDVIVQRLQVINSPYKSTFDAVRRIYTEEGIKGYYRGLGATFIVSILASSIWWTAYENVKKLLYSPSVLPYLVWSKSSDENNIDIHRIPQVTAGFVAGTVTSACVNPLDVVKTRIQTQHIPTLGTNKSTVIYKNIFHGLKCLWSEEGMQGLLRGVLPKLMSRGPLSALSALIFELVLFYSRDDIQHF